MKKLEIQVIAFIIMLIRSLERTFNPMRYTDSNLYWSHFPIQFKWLDNIPFYIVRVFLSKWLDNIPSYIVCDFITKWLDNIPSYMVFDFLSKWLNNIPSYIVSVFLSNG